MKSGESRVECGVFFVGAAICAAMIWAALRLNEPFYSACAMFTAGAWGAVAGCALWSGIRRWGTRDAEREWCTIVWRK